MPIEMPLKLHHLLPVLTYRCNPGARRQRTGSADAGPDCSAEHGDDALEGVMRWLPRTERQKDEDERRRRTVMSWASETDQLARALLLDARAPGRNWTLLAPARDFFGVFRNVNPREPTVITLSCEKW